MTWLIIGPFKLEISRRIHRDARKYTCPRKAPKTIMMSPGIKACKPAMTSDVVKYDDNVTVVYKNENKLS